MFPHVALLQEAAEAVRNKATTSCTSLSGSSGALLIALTGSPCLVFCASEEKALQFHRDLLFWSRMAKTELPILLHPEDSPEHAKSIAGLYTSGHTKIVAPVQAAPSVLWKPDEYPSVPVCRGESMERDSFVQNLAEQGYLNVPLVSGQGEMSLRGGILDVFPPDSEQPLRIELFGDEVESLRLFDVETQLSVSEIDKMDICPASAPEEGQNILELCPDSTVILIEADDTKRHYPELEALLQSRHVVAFTSLPLEGKGIRCQVTSLSGLGLLRSERSTIDDFIQKTIELSRKFAVSIVCASDGQAMRLKDLFIENDGDVHIAFGEEVYGKTGVPSIYIGEISSGFMLQDSIVLSSTDVFGARPAFKSARPSKVSSLISATEAFAKGDYLVHLEHGIGKFLGIRKETIEGRSYDFAVIEYQGGDKIFVPLERINYVQKYHAPEGIKPKVDRLGSKAWQKTRQKVQKKVREMAEHLLKIYAGRTTAKGHAFSDDTELHREFDGFFPYEATPDQLSSSEEIKRDMELATPMDRLLCGDVGYGKTEVIMRACFKAVYDAKQVAVLVPTTILAEQHFETFQSRFSAFPVTIDFLSRFKEKGEQKKTVKNISEGNIDIIIGTHRLLGKDIRFFDLGLLVIDEEHKFGVAHKEKIKALKTAVDVLTLSATPIPRTLHMAVSGIRGMSSIETPPEDRLAVKSTVARFRPELIREVLQHELDRGGQSFFVHNRINDIYEMGTFIQGLVPEGKIGIAHGQMKEKELEQVMHRFFQKEINILISTAIIGAGLDIPSANTIVINRADRFGLADLYQLRGRVGRSNIRAYAYFLIPGEDIISEQARKKLQAIQELGYLGAGFRLALKDLEIRGAGNLLGAEQSGHIEAVGFDMYMEMLESAVAELKGEKTAPEIETEIDLKVDAMVPESYVENPDIRLGIYRKISSARDIRSMEKLFDELKDRFGPPPDETARLIEIMELKSLAQQLLVSKVQNMGGRVKVLFPSETPVTPEQIFALHAAREGVIRFLPEGGFELDLRKKPWRDMFTEIKKTFVELGAEVSQA